MSAGPPKISQWSEQIPKDAPGVLAARPTVPTSWQLYCGALGYWLPHALNRSATYRRALRHLH